MEVSEVRKEQKSKNLFATFLEGDQKISSFHKKVVVLVGSTKAGKSTSHHWLTAKPLKAEFKYGKTYYTCLTDDGAPISSQMASQTLVPNAIELKDNVSLVDVAGFADNRDHIGVIGVSYMLKAIFEKVEEIKFIIVISADKVETIEAETFVTPFRGFFNMFNYSSFSPALKKKLADSVSVLITKSKHPLDQYVDMLTGATLQLEDPSLKNVKYKEETIQLVKHLIEMKKIEVFPAAVKDEEAKATRVLEILEKKPWNYLNIAEMDTLFRKDLGENPNKDLLEKGFVKLPFLEDFEKLSQDERSKAKKSIEGKIDSYKNACQVIKNFIERAQTDRNWYKSQISYELEFQKLKEFLKQFNVYGEVEVSEAYRSKVIEMKMQITKPNSRINAVHGLELLNNLGPIYENTVLITERADNVTKKKLQYVWILFLEALKHCKKTFCQTQEEQIAFMDFVFVLGRGCRELSLLSGVDKMLSSDSFFKIQQFLQGVFTKKLQQLKSSFISEMRDENRNVLFVDQQKLTDYVSFIREAMKLNNNNKNAIQLKYQVMVIEKTKGQLLMRQKKFEEALKSFIGTNQSLNAYSQQQENNFEDQFGASNEQTNPELQKIRHTIETLQIAIYKSIARCLDSYGRSEESLNFYKYINYTHSVIETFRKIIAKAAEGQTRMQKLIDLADYCKKEGRTYQAIEVYQQAYEDAPTYEIREKIKKEIQKVRVDKDFVEEKYSKTLFKRKLKDGKDPIIDLKEAIELGEL